MDINVNPIKDIVTIIFHGEINQDRIKYFKSRLDKFFKNFYPKSLIINLDDTTATDSTLIGLLLYVYKFFSVRGTKLEIQKPPSHIEQVLNLAGVNKIIKIN